MQTIPFIVVIIIGLFALWVIAKSIQGLFFRDEVSGGRPAEPPMGSSVVYREWKCFFYPHNDSSDCYVAVGIARSDTHHLHAPSWWGLLEEVDDWEDAQSRVKCLAKGDMYCSHVEDCDAGGGSNQ